MKRHPLLQDLSRDHHHVLMHARRLLGEDATVSIDRAISAFRAYFEAVLVHHFAEEEAWFPLLPEAERAAALLDHQELRLAVPNLRDNHESAHAVGVLLRKHVRAREAIFEAMQSMHAADTLAKIGAVATVLRTRLRPLAMHRGHVEPCFL